jgi:hypothetical protein
MYNQFNIKRQISITPDCFYLDKKELNKYIKSLNPIKVYRQANWWITVDVKDGLQYMIDVRDFYKLKKHQMFVEWI